MADATYDWVGKSTDTKPTRANMNKGTLAYETDTGDRFVWDGAAWVAYTVGAGGGGGGGGGDASAANQVIGNASLSVLDDWDESDRAKVNLVVGQAGITAGAGATAANTPRVTVATDDTVLGSLTETAPATDTASSGLNGRLQRIAQRLSSLITALGSPFQAGGALGAGSALIGKVGIDQTTPGTTNAVSAVLTTGAAVIGHVIVDSGAITLPTGASTAAKQPALGTAGSASADVITIQGIASGTVVPVSVPADPFGVNADAASATGSISAKLRFIAGTGIPVTGTVTVAAHAVTVASGGVASGAFASGALASGAIVDGAIVTIGAKADAKSTATDTTSVTLMQVLKQVSASVQLMVFGAGTAATAQRTTLASDDPAVATLGATTGTKVVTDANGTIQQFLRGLVTFYANALGAGTAAAAIRHTLASDDPAVATLGATSGAAVITDANGTIQQYLRGIIKLAITAGGWLVTLNSTTRAYLETAASAAVTITIASLASSSTFVAGTESDAIDNTSNKYEDYSLGGKITTGTTPTAGEIRVYVAGLVDDSVYPDVLDGTSSAETITSAGILDAATRLVARIVTDTTSNRTYWIGPTSIRAAFGGFLPKKFVVYVAHSTVAVLHATGSNHALSVVGQYTSLH